MGAGPSPWWNDLCVEVVLRAARARFPSLRIFDFEGELRLVGAAGGRDAFAAGITGLMPLLDDMGIAYHTKESKRWRPTRSAPWTGFVADTNRGVVEMEGGNVAKAPGLRQESFGLYTGSSVSARVFLSAASYGGPGWFLPPPFRVACRE